MASEDTISYCRDRTEHRTEDSSSNRSYSTEATETDPLLASTRTVLAEAESDLKARPIIRGLFWIEVALFTNVFLAGFDGTVTASTYAVITSEFQGANLASWVSTSYLVTTTALQPLYGRLSDIFGRRICLLAATTLFGLGCLGCAVSPDLAALIAMRALAGAGGGGLMTMATIINTDLIAAEQRGMYQAVQNILHGVGSILGASLGGTIAGAIGWRFCFLLQVPICVAAFVIARIVVPATTSSQHHQPTKAIEAPAQPTSDLLPNTLSNSLADPLLEETVVDEDLVPGKNKGKSTWQQVDFLGAFLLTTGLSLLLAAMSAGSNASSWTHPAVLGCLAGSLFLLASFLAVEARTTAVPLLPLGMLHGTERVPLLIANVCLGISGYGFLFLMPLFFQAVLLDSASVAGLRLVASSLATPIGGLTTGILMKRFSARFGNRILAFLTRSGATILVIGGFFNLALGMHDASWKYAAYLTVGGFGQGMSYPASLFSFIGACDHSEHAVATYLVYLVRSVGSVCGVAAISTIVQTRLISRLSETFSGIPGGDELIDTLTHSVEALRDLPLETQQVVQAIYYEACRTGLFFLLGIGFITVFCAFLASPRRQAA